MDIIFYWKKKYFAEEYQIVLSNYKLYTNYPPNGMSVGDTMWVVTKNTETYILVGKFIIGQTKREPSVNGDYCIVADQSASVYYKLDDVNQKKFKSLIQGLFNWPNEEIGVYFRGKKHIQILNQHQKLENFSKTLKII